MKSMKTLPVRLTPGQDLRAALEAAVQAQNAAQPLCCQALAAYPRQASGWRGRISLRG